MTAAVAVLPLGLLPMRPFQLWFNIRHVHPVHDRRQWLTVTRTCCDSCSSYKQSPNGADSSQGCRNDRCLPLWLGMAVNSLYQFCTSDTNAYTVNSMELLTVFVALKSFLLYVQGHHVLIKTDNTSTVAYINRQGGVHSL